MSVERDHPRYEVEIVVDCSTSDMFLSNHVTNLSRGGLFMQGDTPLPLDAEVKMVIWLPGRSAIRARGRVVWNYDIRKGTSRIVPGSGIKFVDIPATDRALLHDYIHELAQTSLASSTH